MELQTILQILYANDMENVISLATRIDNKIAFEQKEHIVVQVSKESVAKHLNMQPKGRDNYWINILLPVLGFNQYKLTDQYLVRMPDGGTKWVSDKKESITELEPIQQPIV